MQNKKFVAAFFAVLIVVSGFIFSYFYKSEASIAQEDDSLIATGTVEADTVKASFKVAGRIDTMLVREGDKVEKGQELAILDTTEINAKVTQAQGASDAANAQAEQAQHGVGLTSDTVEAKINQVQSKVGQAESKIAQVDSKIAQADSKIAQAETDLKNAQQTYDRVAALHESGVATDAQFDEAANNLQGKKGQLSEAKAGRKEAVAGRKEAAAGVREAQAGLQEAVAARTSVDVAQSQYEAAVGQSLQAEGALAEAESYLNNACLIAPTSGYITEKYLGEGEMCNAGTPIFEISDLEQAYVTVFFSETKISRINLHQKAKVTFEGQSGNPIEGEVIWIADAGDFAVKKAVNDLNEHDVRSFEVKIALPNPDLVLKTGMTATVEIVEEGEKGGGNN